ncbi:hypothetical protein DPMN_088284 [Dreissena polymorpha]|uniref:Uncharacterized protein n=1 Tax=Dreissena polymorpha TaxID=45954 RepID=A0A9D4KUS3_DREPO|nr:hypothetical protein DPMN_088284 [Dreissena polymorpha]
MKCSCSFLLGIQPYFLGAEGEACTFDPVNNPSPEELLCPHCTLDKYQVYAAKLSETNPTIKGCYLSLVLH